MYAKSFMALDGKGRLTGARTAQTAPCDHYTCHLCGSALQYHPEYQTAHPWFEHRHHALTENGQQHCPYVNPGVRETRHIRQLQWYVQEARPLVFYADWHCHGCSSDYHGECYCMTCRTGEHSCALNDADSRIAEVTACAC
ncbi:putative zinc ribbon protein [Serratia marcescens]|uniref:putative zinc ribbon protein n=1 Tax=Serratia marcescens TaxID=615 RepID=UPI0024C4A551|nr:putative zinc ribbon protein [Serratia marcescens]MDK1711706.1 putative zinc ribbon protein [Serratia marcescens]